MAKYKLFISGFCHRSYYTENGLKLIKDEGAMGHFFLRDYTLTIGRMACFSHFGFVFPCFSKSTMIYKFVLKDEK